MARVCPSPSIFTLDDDQITPDQFKLSGEYSTWLNENQPETPPGSPSLFSHWPPSSLMRVSPVPLPAEPVSDSVDDLRVQPSVYSDYDNLQVGILTDSSDDYIIPPLVQHYPPLVQHQHVSVQSSNFNPQQKYKYDNIHVTINLPFANITNHPLIKAMLASAKRYNAIGVQLYAPKEILQAFERLFAGGTSTTPLRFINVIYVVEGMRSADYPREQLSVDR